MSNRKDICSLDRHLENFRQLDGIAPRGLRQLREKALSRFGELGFPSTRLEDWKYTNAAPLARQSFRLGTQRTPSDQAAELVKDAGFGIGSEMVFVNGHYAPSLSSPRSSPGGAILSCLATALEEHSPLVEPHLARCAGYETQGLTALNTAFIRDGAFVYVPEGAVLEEPIHLIFVSDAPEGPSVAHPRNLIVAQESSRATVVEHYLGINNATYWTNAVSEIVVGPNAGLSHYKVQREGEAAFHVATIAARQQADSHFTSHSVSLGGMLVRNDIMTVLDATGSDCAFDGLYLVSGKQHVDHHTTIDHQKPYCGSRELYKGILDGRSTGVFNGKVFVRPSAQKSDAHQVNKNLLLSEHAVVNTKPQLEIFADDVKCSHGATVGRLDDDAIFYLRARGIGEIDARHLLIYAFANELIERVKVEPLRAQLERILRARLQESARTEVFS